MPFTATTFRNLHQSTKNDVWATKKFLHMIRYNGFFRYEINDVIDRSDILHYLHNRSKFRDWLDCNNYDVTEYEEKRQGQRYWMKHVVNT